MRTIGANGMSRFRRASTSSRPDHDEDVEDAEVDGVGADDHEQQDQVRSGWRGRANGRSRRPTRGTLSSSSSTLPMKRVAMMAQAMLGVSVKRLGPGVRPCYRNRAHQHGDGRGYGDAEGESGIRAALASALLAGSDGDAFDCALAELVAEAGELLRGIGQRDETDPVMPGIRPARSDAGAPGHGGALRRDSVRWAAASGVRGHEPTRVPRSCGADRISESPKTRR